MRDRSSYFEAVDQRYKDENPLDDPSYIYSLRNPVGFYQKFLVERNMIDLFNRNDIPLSEKDQILDLGCGTGYWLRRFGELKGSSAGLVGVDLSKARIVQAGRINADVSFCRSDMCSLPFKTASFDVVTAFVSFMFLLEERDILEAFGEVQRVLKKGGYFVFYDQRGGKRAGKDTRGFHEREVRAMASKTGIKYCGRESLFKRILFINKSTTAYLASLVPSEILLLAERLPFLPSSYMILLFKKP